MHRLHLQPPGLRIVSGALPVRLLPPAPRGPSNHAIDCDMDEDCMCSPQRARNQDAECSRCHAEGSDIEADGLCPSCHIYLEGDAYVPLGGTGSPDNETPAEEVAV